MLKVFIGYDDKEKVAFNVCAHSIIRRSSRPVSIIPIKLDQLGEFNRGREPNQSTDFSFSRFLTPYLSGYSGQSIFMDCDMLVLCDIHEVLDYCDSPSKDVFLVKHNYEPKTQIKFLGNKQTVYPKKNWSSFMVFNCNNFPCRKLTAESVSLQTGKWLHQFEWTDESRIGELPSEFNHLVGEYDPNPDAKIVHFTLGTPCFRGYEDQEFSDVWFNELKDVAYADN